MSHRVAKVASFCRWIQRILMSFNDRFVYTTVMFMSHRVAKLAVLPLDLAIFVYVNQRQILLTLYCRDVYGSQDCQCSNFAVGSSDCFMFFSDTFPRLGIINFFIFLSTCLDVVFKNFRIQRIFSYFQRCIQRHTQKELVSLFITSPAHLSLRKCPSLFELVEGYFVLNKATIFFCLNVLFHLCCSLFIHLINIFLPLDIFLT